MGLLPQPSGDLQGIDVEVVPPGCFIADLVQLAVMTAAEGNGELIADFQTDGTGLGIAQVVRIGWLPAADQAWLGGDELQVRLVAQPLGLGDGKRAFVDTTSFCRSRRLPTSELRAPASNVTPPPSTMKKAPAMTPAIKARRRRTARKPTGQSLVMTVPSFRR